MTGSKCAPIVVEILKTSIVEVDSYMKRLRGYSNNMGSPIVSMY